MDYWADTDDNPENGVVIRIWFNALKNSLNANALDQAISQLAAWKEYGSLESYYYYYICVFIKAIQGSARASKSLYELQTQLIEKSKNLANSRAIFEWLGNGKGLERLKSYHISELKTIQKRIEAGENIEWPLASLKGTIFSYKNISSAVIRSNNSDVFFVPDQSKTIISPSDIEKSVEFSLGFSFEGPRAYNNSVTLLSGDAIHKSITYELTTGLSERCQVIANNRYYVQLKFLDFPDTYGSVYYRDLNNGFSDGKRPQKGTILYCTIIGEKKGKYWQMEIDENQSAE